MLKYKFLKLGPNMRLVGCIAIISLPVQKYIQYLQYLPWPCNVRNFGAICAKEGLFTLGRFQTWIKPRISVHTSGRYHLYIQSARASVALNSPAPYSRMDSDVWASVFIIHQLEKNRSESDSNDIVSLCLYRYSWGVGRSYSLILWTIFRTISLLCLVWTGLYTRN